MNVAKAIYASITGISPLMAEEAAIAPASMAKSPTDGLGGCGVYYLAHTFLRMVDDIRDGHFEPNIIYKGKEPGRICLLSTVSASGHRAVSYPSIPPALETYYTKKYCHKDASEKQ